MADAGFDMEACIEGLRRQDERAASDFVRELYPLVLKIVRSHLPRRSSEEDLCQIVFIKVLSNIAQYSGKVPIAHWVSRIAVNTCLNALKAESIRPELRWSDLSADQAEFLENLASNSGASGSSAAAGPPGFAGPSSAAASRDLVETLLGALKPQDRLLITMLHLDGYSMDDVRQATGWNIGAIKVRAFRARQKLKKIFEKLSSQGKL
jgi:RNA polymerase sigma-70 factor (ECF subfamily)